MLGFSSEGTLIERLCSSPVRIRDRGIESPERAQETEVPGPPTVLVDPAVPFPTHRDPERFIQEEHAAPALVMVAFHSGDFSAQEQLVHAAPTVCGTAQPFSDPGLVEAFLPHSTRCVP